MSLSIPYSWKLLENILGYIKSYINVLWKQAYFKWSLVIQLLLQINYIAGIELGAVDVKIIITWFLSLKILEFSVRERCMNTNCQYHMPSAHIEVIIGCCERTKKEQLFILGRSVIVLRRERNGWVLKEKWQFLKNSLVQ